MKKYDTVIFDMDGTLLNTIEDIADSVNYILKKYGYKERTIDEINSFVGKGAGILMEKALPDGINKRDFEKYLEEYKEYYLNNNNIKTSPYEGIIEMLAELSDRNYKIAVVSNKNNSNIKDLNTIYFNDYIKTAIGESKSVNRKPAPDMVNIALEELCSKAENAVFVGDSDVDIHTAKNAGMPCVSVCWGFRSREFLIKNGAEHLIDKPHELLEFLGEQSSSANATT